jgi:hypothetical protein
MGHTCGLDEGRDAHIDSLRTVLTRILEATGEVDESTLEAIERASIGALEKWIVDAALAR